MTAKKALEEKDLQRFEKKHGLKLPASYRAFLLRHNGGIPVKRGYDGDVDAYVVEIYALDGKEMRDDFDVVFPKCMKRGLLPLALEGTGGRFFLGLEDGAVLFWDHESGEDIPHPKNLLKLEPDVETFVGKLGGIEGEEALDEIEQFAAKGRASDLERHLEKYDVNAKSKKGSTLVQIAAEEGNLELVEACSRRGANLDGAIAFAAMGGQKKVIEYLLGQGRDINEEYKTLTPLTWGGHNGPAFERWMMSKGASG